MTVRILLFLLLSVPIAAAEARMYQWIDPDTLTTQLSGKPPTWYRSTEGGPRVLVFEKGRMVDDTGVAVSEADRERLRQEALVRAEQDQARIEEKLAEARRLQAVMPKEQAADEEPAGPLEEVVVEPELPAPAEENSTMEAMRALVEKWEELRDAGARMLVGEEQ